MYVKREYDNISYRQLLELKEEIEEWVKENSCRMWEEVYKF